MIFFTATTESLTLVTAAALSLDWSVGYVDIDTIAGATPGSSQGTVSTATTTTVVPAPAASVQRQLKFFTAVNKDAVSTQTLTLNKVTGAGTFNIRRNIPLLPNETLLWVDSVGFAILTASGVPKVANALTDLGTGVAAFLASPTSANLAVALTDETGTGANVFATSPTLVTPVLGVASGTSVTWSSTDTAAAFIPSGSSAPTNGLYLAATNSVALSTNSAERFRLDSTGNAGFGVSPANWHSAYKTIDIQTRGLGLSGSNDSGAISVNAYFDAADVRWEYKGTSSLSPVKIEFYDGLVTFSRAASGTANAAITWIDTLTINNTGQVSIKTAGKGLSITEGSNCKQGLTGNLVAGVLVVANTSVTSDSRIQLTRETAGGTLGHISYTKVAGTSFTITSTSATETSTFVYSIFEPS